MTPKYNELLGEIRDRLSKLAICFSQMISPLDAARSLIGAGLTVMRSTQGDEYTAEYFYALGDELLGEINMEKAANEPKQPRH